jgi:predicted ArsR family transcriptional regulator
MAALRDAYTPTMLASMTRDNEGRFYRKHETIQLAITAPYICPIHLLLSNSTTSELQVKENLDIWDGQIWKSHACVFHLKGCPLP